MIWTKIKTTTTADATAAQEGLLAQAVFIGQNRSALTIKIIDPKSPHKNYNLWQQWTNCYSQLNDVYTGYLY